MNDDRLVEQARETSHHLQTGHSVVNTKGLSEVLTGLADEVERLEAALKNIALARCLGNTAPPGCSGTCVTCEARAALEGTTSEVRVGAIAGLQARVDALEAGLREHRRGIRFRDVGQGIHRGGSAQSVNERLWALLDAGQTDQGDQT